MLQHTKSKRIKLYLLLITMMFSFQSFAQSLPTQSKSLPKRIISLSPSTTEMAFAAGLGENLVGVSAYSDYPEQAKSIEKVASWNGVNLERIVALKPDLILAWRGGNPKRPLDQLEHLGIPIFYSDPQNIDDIADDLDKLAQLSTTPDKGRQAAAQLRQDVQSLKEKYQQDKPKPVFFQLGQHPIFTASAKTLQSEVITLCGGNNIFANSPAQWPQVSREQVLTRKPDYILISGDEKEQAAVKAFWYPQLEAKIISIDADNFYRGSPRILEAARSLCEQLNNK